MALNMKYQIVVIGAGAGGLVVAIGAAKAGKKVLLIDKGHWGGDCTNFGCIPSKTLIAFAEAAHKMEPGDSLKAKGIEALKTVRAVVAEVRSHEDPPALKEKGVETLTGVAHFVSPHEVEVCIPNGIKKTVRSKTFVIATGSSPNIPDVEGLPNVPYLTNETVFNLKEVPKSLVVLGGGPIGCELAQAFGRLGSKVTLVHRREHLLKKEELAVASVIAQAFANERMDCRLGYVTEKVSYDEGSFSVLIKDKTHAETVQAEALLVSVGRQPNILDLTLDNALVEVEKGGIKIDAYGRTTQKQIFAIGDVTGGPAFTHYAENQGRTVLATLLMPGPLKKRLDVAQPVPRVTFTDPEVASAGMLEQEALKVLGVKKIAVYTVPFTEVDRAITAGRTEGFVKVITRKWSSKILGVTIVGPRAGEMLAEVTLAMRHHISLKKLASMIHAYPTYSLAIRRAADLWLTQTLLPALKRKK